MVGEEADGAGNTAGELPLDRGVSVLRAEAGAPGALQRGRLRRVSGRVSGGCPAACPAAPCVEVAAGRLRFIYFIFSCLFVLSPAGPGRPSWRSGRPPRGGPGLRPVRPEGSRTRWDPPVSRCRRGPVAFPRPRAPGAFPEERDEAAGAGPPRAACALLPPCGRRGRCRQGAGRQEGHRGGCPGPIGPSPRTKGDPSQRAPKRGRPEASAPPIRSVAL